MMRSTNRRAVLLWTSLALLLWASPSHAAGTVTLSSTTAVGGDVTRYTYAWTSTTGGAVSGDTTTIIVREGMLLKVELVPGTSGNQPTDLYDVTLLDSHSVDVLQGGGANLSNAASQMLTGLDVWLDRGEALQLVVANAGSARSGTIVLWLGR